jgi:hypothetical protein
MRSSRRSAGSAHRACAINRPVILSLRALFLRIVEPASASSRRAEARRRCPPGCSTSPLRPGICPRAFGIHFPLYLRATISSATLWPSGLQQYLCRCRSLRRPVAAKSSGDGGQLQEPAAGDRLNTKFQLLESFRLGTQCGEEGAVHFCAEPAAAVLRWKPIGRPAPTDGPSRLRSAFYRQAASFFRS